MIVFLDVQHQLIKFYTEKGIDTYEFDEVDDFVAVIGKNKVMYVTNAINVTGKQILETVNGIIASGAQIEDPDGFNAMDNETKFLQSTQKGILHVQDVNVTFEGPGDCKQIDDEMVELIKESVIMRSLLKQGKLKIVDYATMKKSSRKQKKNQEKFQKLRQASKDAELDSIIISSDRKGSAEAVAAGMFSGGRDVETTDITDSIMNDPTERMTAAELDEALKSGQLSP